MVANDMWNQMDTSQMANLKWQKALGFQATADEPAQRKWQISNGKSTEHTGPAFASEFLDLTFDF